jgi:hypothetical protein
MDLSTIILTSVIILAGAVPFAISAWYIKKKKKAFLQTLFDAAEKKGFKISRSDQWHDRAIGMDEAGKWVLFMQIVRGESMYNAVSLSQVKKCSMMLDNKELTGPVTVPLHGTRLELILTSRDSNQPAWVFEFYNVNHDNLNSAPDYKMAEKWSGMINATLGK